MLPNNTSNTIYLKWHLVTRMWLYPYPGGRTHTRARAGIEIENLTDRPPGSQDHQTARFQGFQKYNAKKQAPESSVRAVAGPSKGTVPPEKARITQLDELIGLNRYRRAAK